MHKILLGALTAFVLCVAGAVTPALALDPLGIYVGGAVGQSHVRTNETKSAVALEIKEQHTAWKLLAGVRPISVLGAEFEYIDFGRAQVGNSTNGVGAVADAHPKATAVFGLLYLPLPLPVLDVYGKAGLARLQSTVNASGCPLGSFCIGNPTYRSNRTESRFAYGAGVQAKFLGVAARLEYERISANSGDPDLFSLGVNWTF